MDLAIFVDFRLAESRILFHFLPSSGHTTACKLDISLQSLSILIPRLQAVVRPLDGKNQLK